MDLGTTNSGVAWVEPATGSPRALGGGAVPSAVSFGGEGRAVVGAGARGAGARGLEGTAFSSVKRLLGRLPKELDNRIFDLVPYEINDEDAGAEVQLVLGERRLAPEAVSAEVLKELKRRAEADLGEEVTSAVIAVPARFGAPQKAATRRAFELAGLSVLRVIAEPAAAALAYGFGREEQEVVCVVDLGGGTLDVSVLQVGGGVCEVLSSGGDDFLGGDDYDACIVDWVLRRLGEGPGTRAQLDPAALHRLQEAAEAAKNRLSTAPVAALDLPGLLPAAGADLKSCVSFRGELGRAEFQNMTRPLTDRVKSCILEVTADVRDAQGEPVTLQEMGVVLVGGGTQMPAVRDLVWEVFGREPPAGEGVDPSEAVALGAALGAAVIEGTVQRTEAVLLDETPDVEDLNVLANKLLELLGDELPDEA